MDASSRIAQEWLTIGELAEATGVAAATLRAWEARHDFPRAQRTPRGHRRYARAEIEVVRDVVRLREDGLQLENAVALAQEARTQPPAAVYPEIVRRHPAERTQQLRKLSLLGLSWAIEDEVAASGAQGHLFGAFQQWRNFASARARWDELARTARSTHVFALDGEVATSDALHAVHLEPDAPMVREWTVVHDSPELAVALAAWELPGQSGLPDRERVFESVWTLDPAAVRDAARLCASVAAGRGDTDARDLLQGALAGSPSPSGASPGTATRLAQRALAYVEAGHR
ncbi:DICT sensory domain-containing protein [Nocardioides flavescens]|nr:DICT sensory domain-containing protein [Nocardioides flavescens]